MIVLGLDLGRKNIGVAISRSGVLAEPFGVWQALPVKEFLKQLHALIIKERVERVVVGFPKTANAQQKKEFRALAERIWQTTKIPVSEIEEDFSTEEAKSTAKNKNEAAHHDASAAQIILERFLSEL